MQQWIQRLEQSYDEMVAWRRHLHRNPEPSFQEKQTAAFVSQLLTSWGIPHRTGVGGYGIVARIEGKQQGKTVALRADIDALCIQDEKTCAYASTVPGVMHACGHDAHTASLLAIARTLQETREQWNGTVVCLFQPAEEISPGGAQAMIAEGALDGVDAVYGVHLWTPFPVGTVRTAPGPLMAAADEFVIQIRGKGGHGGLPHETIDSLVVGAHLVINLQTIASRTIDPLQPCVVSVGTIQAGSGFNVIAETCRLNGTVRTFREDVRERIVAQLEQICAHTGAMFGADVTLDYIAGYPTVVNDAQEAARGMRVAAKLFGDDCAAETAPVMAGEDFSYYLQRVPGCFFFVGAGNQAAGITAPHHHPQFDVDETAMLQAAQLLMGVTHDVLTNG